MEKILKIFEVEGVKPKQCEYGTCDGFEIITEKQRILIAIDNEKSCCEQFGYFSSVDNFDEFIGADLLEIKIVDEALNVATLPDYCLEDGGGVMFVNFETSKGTLQFAAYNAHNGYYGHHAYVESEQLTHEMCL